MDGDDGERESQSVVYFNAQVEAAFVSELLVTCPFLYPARHHTLLRRPSVRYYAHNSPPFTYAGRSAHVCDTVSVPAGSEASRHAGLRVDLILRRNAH